MVRPVHRVLTELRVLQAQQAQMVLRDQQVFVASMALQDHKVQPAQASRVRPARKAFVVSMARQELLAVRQVLQELILLSQVQLALLVQLVRQVLVQQVSRVQLAQLVLSVQPGRL